MKYLIFLVILFFPQISLFAECVISDSTTQDAVSFLSNCSTGTKGVEVTGALGKDETTQKVITIANGAISFGALLAVGAIVWAGIQYTKSLGDDEKLKKAKTTGIYAVIGLILLLISFGIVDIFINFVYQATGN